MAHGRWEHLQIADLFIVHPDGSGLTRITDHGNFCGSAKFTADSRRVIAYCMPAEQTLETRRPMPVPGNDTTIVSIDITTKAVAELPAGPGVKMSPAPLPGNDIGYVRKDTQGDGKGIYYTSGARGPQGDVRVASWSPDGRRVVFHRRLAAPAATWVKSFSPNADYELIATGILPSFNRSGDRVVFTTRPVGGVLGAGVAVATAGSDKYDVIYQDKTRNILAPQFSPSGDRIIFGIGVFNLFFNGFIGRLGETSDRVEGGAQIAMINADGSGYTEVTAGPSNNGFPSMAPDGERFVYRTFGTDGDGGLRIMNLATRAVTTLTSGNDNFPLWSPRGDKIMFARFDKGEYEVYTIKPDGTGLLQVTHSHGNDAHMAWSPDGESIVFASTRMGFKDEGVYTDAPQPYGELFVMKADGTGIEQLTDNQWEEGTPAWQPPGK
jgi:Tol biopolymer transport system component